MKSFSCFQWNVLNKAKAFPASDDLDQAMQKAGVNDKRDVYFLE